MRIMYATPAAAGMVHLEYHQSVLFETLLHPERIKEHEKYQITPQHLKGYSGLGKDRSIMASTALRLGMDKLVFIDADQAWKWHDFKALVDSDKEIISAVIPIKQYPLQLNFTPTVEDSDLFKGPWGTAVTVEGLIKMKQKHQKSEVPVQLIGTGMVCIDMKVFRKLAETCPSFKYHDHKGNTTQNWDFFQSGVVNGRYYGEDGAFCLQANRAGFIPHIHLDVLIPHVGSHLYIIGNQLTSIEMKDPLTFDGDV